MGATDFDRVANFLLSYQKVSIPTIMEQMGISEKRIRHIIDVFQQNGLIKVDTQNDTASVTETAPAY